MSNEGSRRPAAPPASVRKLATGRRVRLAWENEDALTFEVGDGPDRRFVKWAPAGSPLDLAAPGARRPAPVLGQLTVVIDGFDLPGLTCAPEPGGQVHRNINVALAGPRKDGHGRGENRPALVIPGSPWLATEPVPGDAPSARWEVPVTVWSRKPCAPGTGWSPGSG